MNSYLNNLAARTAETAPLLHPRLPSLFEPAASGPQISLFAEDQRVDEAVEAQTVAPAQEWSPAPDPLPSDHQKTPQKSAGPPGAPAAAAQLAPASLPVMPAPRAESKSSVERMSTPQTTISAQKEVVRHISETVFLERVVQRSITEPPAEGVRRAARIEETPQLQLPSQPAAASAPARLESTAQPEDMPQIQAQLIRLPAETPAMPLLTPVADHRPGDRVAVESQLGEYAPGRRQPQMPEMSGQVGKRREREVTSPVAVVPHREPAPEQKHRLPPAPTQRFASPDLPQLRPEPQRQPAEPAPPPTVEVHIGRIEVRATPPPAKPLAAKKQRTAVMSLDDYLRQRNGRGRTK